MADAPTDSSARFVGRGKRDEAIATASAFMRLGRGYWLGTEKASARLMSAALLLLVLLGIVMQVGVTQWYALFFNAIEQRSWPELVQAVQLGVVLALAMSLSGAAFIQVKMRLQVRWRQWLTTLLVERWLADRRFYRLSVSNGNGVSNPEYRISEDVRNATEPLVEFVTALITSVLTAATFIGILWHVGGALDIPIAGRTLTIPGFMVLGVLAYSLSATFLMVWIGRPLIARLEARNTAEAELRFGLARTRENAEQIALAGSDADERLHHKNALLATVARWLEVIGREARMVALNNATLTLTPIIPLLLCAPKFLQGGMTLGELVQIQAAFAYVHQSLNWLADNAIRVAEWLASAQRVVELSDALDRTDEWSVSAGVERIRVEESPDATLRLVDLHIADPAGNLLISGPPLTFQRGQNVLIRGASGTGKSTLVRAIAGLWPWGRGIIYKPRHARVSFLLQRPIIPDGALRQAMTYPAKEAEVATERLQYALKRCGLSHLITRLDDNDHWSRVLQGGEQQRLAFARLLVDPPDVVIMDEATSALDELSEASMLELLRTDLSTTTAICIGRRSGLESYFDRFLMLTRDSATGEVSLCEKNGN